jgi:hypothetical protein
MSRANVLKVERSIGAEPKHAMYSWRTLPADRRVAIS